MSMEKMTTKKITKFITSEDHSDMIRMDDTCGFLYFFFSNILSALAHFWSLRQILCVLPSLPGMSGLIKLNKVSDSNAALPGRSPNAKLLCWFSFRCFMSKNSSFLMDSWICCNCDSTNLLSFSCCNKIPDRKWLTVLWSQQEVDCLWTDKGATRSVTISADGISRSWDARTCRSRPKGLRRKTLNYIKKI